MNNVEGTTKILKSASLGTIFVYHAYKKIKMKTPLYIKRFNINTAFGGFEIAVVIGTPPPIPYIHNRYVITELFQYNRIYDLLGQCLTSYKHGNQFLNAKAVERVKSMLS